MWSSKAELVAFSTYYTPHEMHPEKSGIAVVGISLIDQPYHDLEE